MYLCDEIIYQIIVDLSDMLLTEIGLQVVIQFEFTVVEHRLVQLSTGDLSLLSSLEFLSKSSKGLFLNNIVIPAF